MSPPTRARGGFRDTTHRRTAGPFIDPARARGLIDAEQCAVTRSSAQPSRARRWGGSGCFRAGGSIVTEGGSGCMMGHAPRRAQRAAANASSSVSEPRRVPRRSRPTTKPLESSRRCPQRHSRHKRRGLFSFRPRRAGLGRSHAARTESGMVGFFDHHVGSVTRITGARHRKA